MQVLSLIILLPVTSGTHSCTFGSYRSLTPPWRDGCPGFRLCESGFFCNGEIKIPCPSGVVGDREGYSTEKCGHPCPKGFYCPLRTITPLLCGNSSVYCPPSSSRPLPIPSGYFGLGESSNRFEQIEICPKGFYCSSGLKLTCPAGSYGEMQGLDSATCSGQCPAGWFCPTASSSPYSRPCPINPGNYCPRGSSHPIPVALGFYATESAQDRGGGYSLQARCPPGSYCLNGIRYLCPGGRYGALHESINASCDGICEAGWCSDSTTPPISHLSFLSFLSLLLSCVGTVQKAL